MFVLNLVVESMSLCFIYVFKAQTLLGFLCFLVYNAMSARQKLRMRKYGESNRIEKREVL